MSKIIQALLEAKIPSVNITLLLDVISATPNPELATEILCGLYTEIEFPYSRVQSKSDGVYIFKSYDKWQDCVTYSYIHKETKGGNFPKGTKISDVTMETFDKMKVPSGSDTVYLYIPTGKETERQSSMSSISWNELPYAPTEAEIRMNEAQNIYSHLPASQQP